MQKAQFDAFCGRGELTGQIGYYSKFKLNLLLSLMVTTSIGNSIDEDRFSEYMRTKIDCPLPHSSNPHSVPDTLVRLYVNQQMSVPTKYRYFVQTLLVSNLTTIKLSAHSRIEVIAAKSRMRKAKVGNKTQSFLSSDALSFGESISIESRAMLLEWLAQDYNKSHPELPENLQLLFRRTCFALAFVQFYDELLYGGNSIPFKLSEYLM